MDPEPCVIAEHSDRLQIRLELLLETPELVGHEKAVTRGRRVLPSDKSIFAFDAPSLTACFLKAFTTPTVMSSARGFHSPKKRSR